MHVIIDANPQSFHTCTYLRLSLWFYAFNAIVHPDFVTVIKFSTCVTELKVDLSL